MQNGRLKITLTLLTIGAATLIFILCGVCRQLLFVNFTYLVILQFSFLLPALYYRYFIFKDTGYSTAAWVILFTITGIYFTRFESPDLMALLWSNFSSRITVQPFTELLYGVFSWAGFGLFFTVAAGNDFSVPDRNRVFRFFAYYFLYLLYLNGLVKLLNIIFQKNI